MKVGSLLTLKPLQKPLHTMRSFPRFLWHRFWDDHCFEAAGALAYTTMLALVPLGAVSLSIISAFPRFQQAKEQLLTFPRFARLYRFWTETKEKAKAWVRKMPCWPKTGRAKRCRNFVLKPLTAKVQPSRG